MKLIKYWSAVETFFSTDEEKITRSVSVGLTGVLVYGGYAFVPEAEYMDFKKRVVQLYALRSRALHRASYDHVTDHDVDNLSKWVGQCSSTWCRLWSADTRQSHRSRSELRYSMSDAWPPWLRDRLLTAALPSQVVEEFDLARGERAVVVLDVVEGCFERILRTSSVPSIGWRTR